MKKTTNSVSPAQGNEKTETGKTDVVFITIFREDRDWINKTKGDLNREQRLHQIIENFREPGQDPHKLKKCCICGERQEKQHMQWSQVLSEWVCSACKSRE